ncbi:hypothetical protein [Mammaliicoccus sciuri]|uniref:hypothetical protein n=1 Tax=Mammaliicoccus sciuri TaxID=1296 RepID=UPI002B26450D|nr:hypothetical protein [Mammaliicoccus sciuri]WQK75189.1 hypothetical protein P3U33_05525 [Mammaliicoccus sciuri]
MWEITDEFQRVRKIDETTFQVIDMYKDFEDTIFFVLNIEIDLKDYDEKNIENIVIGYYESIEDFKSFCENQEDYNQLLAEMIAEQTGGIEHCKSFTDEKQALIYLEELQKTI